MPTKTVRGARVSFRDEGSGPEVLLLHAFPLHAGMWDATVAALSPRARVVAPDLPGLGGSEPRADAVTMASLADDVLALCDGLGVTRPAVVGLSMGGYLAFEVFRRRPSWFRALGLCDTKAGADAPEAAAAREQFAKDALENGLGWVADRMVPKLLRPGAPAEDVATVRRLVLGGTPQGVAAAQRAMATRPDSTDTLAAIANAEIPVLVLVGAEDGLTPPVESRRIASALPGSRLVEVPGAGHLPAIETPAVFAREVASLLANWGRFRNGGYPPGPGG